MKVFVTGASGWIGSHTVDELIRGGHDVVGLARSDASAAALEAKGVVVRRGDLDDPESIRRGAAEADAVVHLANKHDFADAAGTNAAERRAVQTIVDELAGSDRAFVLASGMAGRPGELQTELTPSVQHGPDSMRGGTENLALEYVERGVRAIPVRFAPTVHGTGDHGFVAALAQNARRRGAAVYIGDGASRWPAVHVEDAARVVVRGLESAPAGTVLNAVGEQGIRSRDIAEALGEFLGVPTASVTADEARRQLGFIGVIFALDLLASSARTQQLLSLTPTGPTLLEDIRSGAYPA